MSCQEYEKWIYTFHELTIDQQMETKAHIATCSDCSKLFNEVEGFLLTVKDISKKHSIQPNSIVENVMTEINKNKSWKKEPISLSSIWSIAQMAMAAVSIGILVLFFTEILVPTLQSGKIKEPLTNIQGVVIKSEDFRKVLIKPKEKKSPLESCKNILTHEIDISCVKEKLEKINL